MNFSGGDLRTHPGIIAPPTGTLYRVNVHEVIWSVSLSMVSLVYLQYGTATYLGVFVVYYPSYVLWE